MYTRDGGEESKKGLGYFNGVFIIINNGLLGQELANRNRILMIFFGEIDRKQRSQRGWVSDTPLGRLEFSG
jgi:hypothetical protein